MNMAKPVGSVLCSPAFLLVFLLGTDSAVMASAAAKVKVWNDMSGETIQMYCGRLRWRDRTILPGQRLGWRFEPGLVGTNQWMCGFKWGTKVQQFLVWADTGMSITNPASRPCLDCEWHVRKDGFWLMSEGLEPAVLYHQWL